MADQHRVRRPSVLLLALLVAACGGAAPSAPAGASTAPSAGTPSGSAAAPDGVTLVDFADTTDPAEAARQELELVHQVREDAGIAALIGANGQAALATLDGIETTAAQGLLGEVAAAVDAGEVPQAGVDPVLGQLASIDSSLPARRLEPAAIDISLFADTGFTTSALMSMLTSLVQRAAESGDGSLPRQETHEDTSNGLRQQVDLRMTTSIQTGGGRVVAEITMVATDRIFDVASGSFVALYTSTSTGHFDVSACPDSSGIAAGTYSFETRHELNDVATATAARSGASRSVEAPFRLINGDDAKLQRIEATFDMGADAFGPGSPGGPGPTSAFDWDARQQVQVVMSPSGSTTASAGAPTASGAGSERAAGAMFVSSAMAQIFLGQVGREAETFWRSGKCVELTPSHDTQDVDPSEEIDLKVEARAKFGEVGPIPKPIKATFSGTTSLDPIDPPQTAPATYHFVAGTEEGDRGTIDLEQVSNRGIGKRQVVYTVSGKPLLVSVTSRAVADIGVTLTYEGDARDLKLTRQGDAYQGTGPITVKITLELTAPGASCSGSASKDYTIGIEAVPVPKPSDQASAPDELDLSFDYPMGQIDQFTIRCESREGAGSMPAPWSGLLTLLPLPGEAKRVTVGETTSFTLPGRDAARVAITVQKAT